MRKTKGYMISMTKGQNERLERLSTQLGITKSEIVNAAMTLIDNSYEVQAKIKAINEILAMYYTAQKTPQIIAERQRKILEITIGYIDPDTKKLHNRDIEQTIEIAKTKWVDEN